MPSSLILSRECYIEFLLIIRISSNNNDSRICKAIWCIGANVNNQKVPQNWRCP